MAKNSLVFDAASSQYIAFGDVLGMYGGTPSDYSGALGLWVKSTQTTTCGLMGRNVAGTAAERYSLINNSASAGKVAGLYQGGVVAAYVAEGTAAWNDGAWHHLGIRFGGIFGVKVYLDGVEVASVAGNGGDFIADSGTTVDFEIGRYTSGAPLHYTGKIAQPFAFIAFPGSTPPVSAAQMADIAAGTLDPSTLSPSAVWDLTEGSGTTITDTGTSGSTGTLTNGVTWDTDIPSQLAPSASFTATPSDLPKNHGGNITITLAGSSTTWAGGGSEFAISGVTGATKISENVTGATAATLVITTDATHTGTLTITDGDSVTHTVTITTATLARSPTSGGTGTTPTITLTGGHTVWAQETASGLFSVSGGTGASIATPTVGSNTSASAVLTVGSGTGTLTITDNSTGATTTFTATRGATTFHFATSGDDSTGDGTSGNPYKTVSKANTLEGSAVAGDVYAFNGGDTFAGNLVLTVTGTQSERRGVTSYGSGKATIAATSGIAVLLHGVEFADVTNITTTNAVTGLGSFSPGSGTGYDYTADDLGIVLYDDRTSGSKLNSLLIQGCEISGGQTGIGVFTPNYGQAVVGFSDVRIVQNDIHDVNVLGINVLGGDGQGDGWSQEKANLPHGKTTFSGLVIQDNNVHDIPGTDISGAAITVSNTTGGLIYRNRCDNIAYDDTIPNAFSWSSASIEVNESDGVWIIGNEVTRNSTTGSLDGDAIDTDIGATNCLVAFNRTALNNGPGYANFNDGTNTFAFNQSFNDCRQNGLGAFFIAANGTTTLYHNTVYMDASSSNLALAVNCSGDVNCFNNIFSVDSGRKLFVVSGTLLAIGNVYYWGGGTANFDGTITTLTAWRVSGQETYNGVDYGVVGNPLLSDPTNTGTFLPGSLLTTCTYFDIASNSPAVGAGVPLEAGGVNTGVFDFHGYPNRTPGRYPDAGSVTYGGVNYDPKPGGGGGSGFGFYRGGMTGGMVG